MREEQVMLLKAPCLLCVRSTKSNMPSTCSLLPLRSGLFVAGPAALSLAALPLGSVASDVCQASLMVRNRILVKKSSRGPPKRAMLKNVISASSPDADPP